MRRAFARRLSALDKRPRLFIDHAVRIEDNDLIIIGRDDTGAVDFASLHAELDDGRHLLLDAQLHRWTTVSRWPDKSAAARCFAARIDAGNARAVKLHLVASDGRTRSRRLAPPGDSPVLERIRLLLETAVEVQEKRRLHDRVTGSAIGTIWSARRRDDANGELVHFNAHLAPDDPRTTLVIPIYGRHDFIEHQLARFSADPTLACEEILYVIDDPALHESVRLQADALARLYPLAFRVLYLERNLGYAGANNAGARHALGRYLLLLNSDVMPWRAGWLDRMFDAAGVQMDSSLVGARMLYEDGSLQHDGMRYEASALHDGLWLNLHPGKGLPASLFPCSSVAEPREAITGACLLLRRDHYERLGGLDEDYLLGDFEDSDLCLKARAAGLGILIATDTPLHHLERQSQSLVADQRWKAEVTGYNRWLHTTRWAESLASLVAARTA